MQTLKPLVRSAASLRRHGNEDKFFSSGNDVSAVFVAADADVLHCTASAAGAVETPGCESSVIVRPPLQKDLVSQRTDIRSLKGHLHF